MKTITMTEHEYKELEKIVKKHRKNDERWLSLPDKEFEKLSWEERLSRNAEYNETEKEFAEIAYIILKDKF